MLLETHMRGFDPGFRDYPDYLHQVTEALWNRRAFGAPLAAFAHPQLILRGSDAIGYGPEALRGTVTELASALPGLQAVTEDVQWSGAPQVGMLGAQRLVISGRHDAAGLFGAPTGKRLRFRVMADLYGKDNRLSDGWMVRDTGAVLRQLGIGVADWARQRMAGRDPDLMPLRPEIDSIGPYTGKGDSNQWGVAFAGLLSRIMTADFASIPAQYDGAARMVYPGGVIGRGASAAERFWLGLRGAFPSAEFRIHHRIGMETRQLPPRAALRWSLSGRHDGWGPFGRPTGAQVHVMGMSHAEFGPGGLRREWTLFDEAAVWMQIHCATGNLIERRQGQQLAAV